MIQKIIISLFLLSIATLQAKTIKIAVATNVSYAIKDLVKSFNVSYPNTKIQVILGSSGKLTAQIKHFAPYTILLSADMKYPEVLYVEGLAMTKPVVYAQGALALLSMKERNYFENMHVLEDKSIDKIAIANPKIAPYGMAAKEALVNVRLYEKLKKKFVYAESISQAVAYTTTAADIGIIAKSSLFSPHMAKYKKSIHWFEVDTSLYTPISQGMVMLKEGKDNAEVKAFYDFMLSDEARVILKSYGYKVK